MGRTYRDGDRDGRAEDVSASEHYLEADPGVVAEACFPIVAGGLTVGVLDVESREPLRDGDLDHLREARRALGARIEELGGLPRESARSACCATSPTSPPCRTPHAVADALLGAALDLVPLGSALLARATGAAARLRPVARGRPAGRRSCAPRALESLAAWVAGRDLAASPSARPRRRPPPTGRAARRRGRDAGRRRSLRAGRAARRPRAGLAPSRPPSAPTTSSCSSSSPPTAPRCLRTAELWARCASARRPTRSPASATTRPSTRRWPARTGARPRPSSCATSTASSSSTTPTATATATASSAALADAMSGALRRGDRLFRIGGDEFAALLAVESPRAGARRGHRACATPSLRGAPGRHGLGRRRRPAGRRDRRRAAGARRPRALLGQGGRPRRRRAGQRRAAAVAARRSAERAERAARATPILGRRTHGRPGPHPQLLDHRPHRPRQVDAGRPHPRDDPDGRSARRCASRCSTRWTSSASAGSRSRPRPCASSTRRATARPTSCTSSTRPGHVDFTYEVSRSLAACEGALLVVDASQGVEAQTLANTYLAVDAGLELIPCLNKIDLPGAEPERVAEEVSELLGEPADAIRRISGKTGEGVEDVLEELVAEGPAAGGRPRRPAARADLRLRVRPVPRRRGLHPRRRRRLPQGRGDPRDGRRAPRPRSTTSASSRRR